jgi:hypothetical protein
MAWGELPTLKANQKSLKISQMRVDIEVIGGVATTTMDITYYNPFNRDLVGEFAMPLNEGEVISRYALMVNGELREGVVVEKVKARKAFEATVRKKIDPAIANITKGNYFRTKIYPIPAKGYKRVVVAFTQRLDSEYYILPLQDQKPIDKFILDIKVLKGSRENLNILAEFNSINITEDDRAYSMHFEKRNFSMKRAIKFRLPKLYSSEYQIFTETIAKKTYFYLNIPTPSLSQKAKKTPKRITIYWDNSLSAIHRDIDKELNLLDSYLKRLKGSKEVSLISFNYRLNVTKKFRITKDTTKLIEYIRSLKNSGGTTLSRLRFDKPTDEILLFSDGISTIGEADTRKIKTPIYTISSSSGSDYRLLKRLASKSSGEFINLNTLSSKEALDRLFVNEEKFISCSYNKKDISEVYPNSPTRVGKLFGVSGILKSSKAEITINYGDQNGVTQKQTFSIEKKGNSSSIARIWATKKVEVLEYNEKRNKKEIQRLGQKYSILTKNSAFIVLDRVEDYLTHHIRPPKKLIGEYNRLLSIEKKEKKDKSISIDKRNLERINALKEWYNTPPKVEREKSLRVEEEDGLGGDIAPVEEPMARESIAPVPVMASPSATREVKSKKTTKPKASIKILAWMPDAPYMKSLRGLKRKDFDKSYYKFEKENRNRPAFYIEVSDYLFTQGRHKRAVRVLTNILELDLANPELLKIVAKRLLNEKEYTMSIMIYKEIKALRPEEPQSYRDLAIAYTHKKEYQKALDIYTYILSKEWGRFDDIKDTIFNEYNALIAKHKKSLNLKRVKKEYIFSMPLDIRITVSWSSNENDIDLWVVDPNGEKCYYSHPHTSVGGKISRDFTRGYGPEEFSIKKAPRGIYTVYLNYFSDSRQSIAGPVTIYATLTTHYGTTKESSKDIMIQLIKGKETMQIGALEFSR